MCTLLISTWAMPECVKVCDLPALHKQAILCAGHVSAPGVVFGPLI